MDSRLRFLLSTWFLERISGSFGIIVVPVDSWTRILNTSKWNIFMYKVWAVPLLNYFVDYANCKHKLAKSYLMIKIILNHLRLISHLIRVVEESPRCSAGTVLILWNRSLHPICYVCKLSWMSGVSDMENCDTTAISVFLLCEWTNDMRNVINRCPEEEYFISSCRISWQESDKLTRNSRLSALHKSKRKTITKRNYKLPSTAICVAYGLTSSIRIVRHRHIFPLLYST